MFNVIYYEYKMNLKMKSFEKSKCYNAFLFAGLS